MFPWRKYSEQDLVVEFQKLQELCRKDLHFRAASPPAPEWRLSSNIGKICSNAFFQYVRMNTPKYKQLYCADFWVKNKNKIMKYYKSNHINDLFGTIVFLNKAPSQFSIITACWAYKFFNAHTVLDPFSGWGDRCIAAMAMDIDYVVCDSNDSLEYWYIKMIELFNSFGHSNSSVKIHITKCELLIQTLNERRFDLMFSSPPFFSRNKLTELYHNTERDEEKFFEECLFPLKNYGFSHCNYICLNLPESMYSRLRKNVREADNIINFGRTRSYDIQNHTKNNLLYCWTMFIQDNCGFSF